MGRRRGKPAEGADQPSSSAPESEQPCCVMRLSECGELMAVGYEANIKVLKQPQRLPEGGDPITVLKPGDDVASNVRTLCFDKAGKHLLGTTDAKQAIVWSTDDWSIRHTFKLPKRATASLCTPDNGHWLLADKYGDVLAMPLIKEEDSPADIKEPAVVLGHCSSILTSMSISPCGKLLATADRDHKIRISQLPKGDAILKGAPLIQTYCLGHTDFVSSVAFLPSAEGKLLLISGGGDGTMRLWDPLEGTLLSTLSLPKQAGTEDYSAVLSLTPAEDTPTTIQVLVDEQMTIRHAHIEVGEPLRLAWSAYEPPSWDKQPHAGAALGKSFFVAGIGPDEISIGRYPVPNNAGDSNAIETLSIKIETKEGAAPRRLLGHLAKTPPSEEEINFRKRQRRDLTGRSSHEES